MLIENRLGKVFQEDWRTVSIKVGGSVSKFQAISDYIMIQVFTFKYWRIAMLKPRILDNTFEVKGRR